MPLAHAPAPVLDDSFGSIGKGPLLRACASSSFELAPTARPAGSTELVRWRDIEVGNIVKVQDEELIPADLLCLHSELPDNVCFIKTTNLDGESNLKIRRSLPHAFLVPAPDGRFLYCVLAPVASLRMQRRHSHLLHLILLHLSCHRLFLPPACLFFRSLPRRLA